MTSRSRPTVSPRSSAPSRLRRVAAARFFGRLVAPLAGGVVLARFALTRAVLARFAGARFGVARLATVRFRVVRFGFVRFTRRLLMIHLPMKAPHA
jgi:hypothetical protein